MNRRRNIIWSLVGSCLLGVFLCLPIIHTSASGTYTVTYDMAQESNAGMDGSIQWQSVFLLNNGKICSFGTGNHAPEQSNAMRIIDPVTVLGSVSTSDLFPWTQDITPPNASTGHDRYVDNYDNHASIYIPSENKVVWINHGVFDFGSSTWTYGNRSPNTQAWTAFLNDPGGMNGVYNPGVAWSSQLDVGVWFGNSGGGYGRSTNDMTLIERSAVGAAQPWKLTVVGMGGQGVQGISYARNTSVCIGPYLYVAGPSASGISFYKIHIPTRTLTATLAPYTAQSNEYYPQMVYDTRRGVIVVIGIKVQEYSLSGNSWSDVTPVGWPGYTSPMGVYHPANDAIYFRGIPTNLTVQSQAFKWHRIVVTGGGGASDTTAPTTPTSLSATPVSQSQVNLAWTASTDAVGVAGYNVYRCSGSSCTPSVQVATASGVTYSGTGLSASTIYGFKVAGFDAAGNLSSLSSTAYATTQAAPVSGSWRQITIDTNKSPFKGPPEEGFGGTKHVWYVWHPVKRRVYTFGGDYGNGAGNFSQPNMGSNFTTNDPITPRTFARDSSLCNDQYSIDPYASGSVQWRLEHPYIVRDMGSGVRENRPGRPDQVSLVWDSVRSKLWGFITVLRTEFLYLASGVPDLWANGDMTTSAPFEPTATYSWVPGTSGSPGTWSIETTNRLTFRSGATSYSGGQLISGIGDERIGLFQYDPVNDVIVCLSASSGGGQAIFIFKPATKTYEYRTFSIPGYSRVDCSSSYCAPVNGWAYAVAITTSGGVRKSSLIRVNIAQALGVANAGSLTSSMMQAFTLPWSLSTGNVWENSGDASSKWQEHAGVIGVAGKVVIVKSYSGVIEDGTTKLTVFDPSTLTFTPGTAAPENIVAHAWVGLPDSNEVFMGGSTTAGYSNLKMWAYSVSGASPPPGDTTPPTVSLTAPSSGVTVSGSSVSVSATASDNVGVSGVQFKLDGVNLGSEDTSSPYTTTWNTTSSSNGPHTLTAVARDAAANTATSTSVSVTVTNGSKTYYVSMSGSDTTGNGTSGAPWKTIGKGLTNMVSGAGDTLLISAGTYIENINNTIPSGTASLRTTIQAVTGDVVVIQPLAPGNASQDAVTLSGKSWIVFRNIRIEGGNVTNYSLRLTGASTNNLFEGGQIRHGNGGGVLFENTPTSSNTIRSVEVWGNTGYGITFGSGSNLVEGCDIHDNTSNGIHVTAGDSNVIRSNRVQTNSGKGIFLSNGSGNLVYNNLVYVNTSYGVEVGTGSVGAKVLSNSLYANTSTAVRVSGGSGAVVSNNILFSNTSDTVDFSGSTGITGSNNLLGLSPLFVNAGGGDFHISSGSPAIDAGATLSDFSVDFAGNSRPFGPSWDIGAYESTAPLPPNVSVTAPSTGATVSGSSVAVTANAASGVGIAGVQFKLDSVNLGSEDTSSPYGVTWDSTLSSNGSHTLTAVARDTSNISTTSFGVSVTVSNGGDTQAPSVSITAPVSGSTVGGATVTVSAAASDNVGVVGVQFKLDGVSLGSEDTVAPYGVTWNSTTASNDIHALSATARDAASNTTTSSIVNVTVSNVQADPPPTVSLTAPANQATVSGAVTLSASASDNLGVSGVQFNLDGLTLGAEDTSSPYAVIWDASGFADGPHILSATARDTGDHLTTSSSVTVNVVNPASVISGVSVSPIASTSATIVWTTDKLSDSQVEYGTTTGYGTTTTLDTSLVTSHSQGLTGLTQFTLYHYRVKSKDTFNRLSVSPDFSFTTAGSGATTITVLSPIDGDVWVYGTTHAITWTSSGVTGNVKIQVSRNGGNTWRTIIPSKAVGLGTADWVINQPSSTSSKIKVISITSPSVFGVSGGLFRVSTK